MLQIKNVCKTYHTGALVQQALDGVSLNLRDSEFVAILGQSGSGKTTLLNVIGGLDRYDEGDLIINGVSTKKYKSRDWDSYRNHSVGFVFQSYNLIPHQTVLANVELALTIGGISKRERTARATEALEKVGLADHIHKKPSQLSGGQMQRVAIARALVNDPDILLADEPTGALDSETSLQVMDLLKEVAQDRLVVMVTHNPELAEQYATRIVRLKDGRITSDSDPFDPGDSESEHRAPARSGMSFLTALNLSLNNLWTKKVRTLLVAFAGSIGIIGIAMILSISNGANQYIRTTEEETLKSYPLQITQTSFDLANMLAPRENDGEPKSEAEVREWNMITNMLSHVANNDLSSLRDYFENGKSGIYDHVQAIEYDYNVTPQIFKINGDKVRQVNPDRSFSALGFSSTDTMSGLMTGFSSTSSFYALPSDPSLYTGQFDVKAGRWPENYNECVLILSRNGYIADLTLYTLGLRDPETLDELVKAFAEGYSADVEEDGERRTYKYDDFLGITFKLLCSYEWYVYDSEYKVWSDRSGDEKFMKQLVEGGEDLKIVGVVQPSEGTDASMITMGIGYPASLTLHIMERSAESRIVTDQLAARDTNVITGVKFGDTNGRDDVDLSSLFEIDEESLAKIFSFDAGALGEAVSGFDLSSLDLSGIDLTSALDASAFDGIKFPELGADEIAKLLDGVEFKADEQAMGDLFGKLADGFISYAAKDQSTDFAKLPDLISDYMQTERAREIMISGVRSAIEKNGAELVDFSALNSMLKDILSAFPDYVKEKGFPKDGKISGYVTDFLKSDAVQDAVGQFKNEFAKKAASVLFDTEQAGGIASALFADYSEYAKEQSLPGVGSIADSFTSYLATPEARSIIASAVSGMIDSEKIEENAKKMFAGYGDSMQSEIAKAASKAFALAAEKIGKEIMKSVSGLTDGLADKLKDSFELDPDALASAFRINFTPDELRDLMSSLLAAEDSSYDGNLRKLGYSSIDNPSMITIYPVDFESKTSIKQIIDDYNAAAEAAGDDDRVITYTDLVDTLMSSVTDIINAISIILIAFVAISLIVSSVMIGVITYISVLERKKEIGILRAIGASKRNISNVFNAETFIIGLLAGVMGILITLLLLIPTNSIIHSLSGQNDINAILPPLGAVLLILLSVVLTLIGGIIPSRKAARSDPVSALRSE